MYDDVTYEQILNRVLSKIPAHVDSRESSLIYMAVAPVCFELYQYYLGLSWAVDQFFIDSQNDENVIKNAKQYGIFPRPATQAIITSKFNKPLDTGLRFKSEENNIIYKVIEHVSSEDGVHKYNLLAETPGTDGNVSSGRLIPLSTVSGLTVSEIESIVLRGDDGENVNQFKFRFLEQIKKEGFGWNESQYIQQIMTLQGVGQCRAVHKTPTSPTDFNVLVYIVNTENETPNQDLVDKVKLFLYENVPHTHNPDVIATQSDVVNISANVVIEDGMSFDALKEEIENSIKVVFDNIISNWYKQKDSVILRQTKIISAVYDVDGVKDVTQVKLNGVLGNYESPVTKILKLGTITLTQGA